MKQKLALRRPFLVFAFASTVLSQSNFANKTTSSTWQTDTNMTEKNYKDNGTIVESLSYDPDGFSEYSPHQTTLSSLDVQKPVSYYTTISMLEGEPKEHVTTNLHSDVPAQVVVGDGESTVQPSATHVTTPRQPNTSDVGRAWYRDSEVRQILWENTQ
ncbi:hypothetical protein BaRGS_00004096 [Batillaria attramentaria]|uniref:Uncharacterized protein n=1 Tax=Batillaria attramentaria TaxID=370345 RepID=A0ABD0LYJ0_9CAEN